jgi:hypothetical protein
MSWSLGSVRFYVYYPMVMAGVLSLSSTMRFGLARIRQDNNHRHHRHPQFRRSPKFPNDRYKKTIPLKQSRQD